ncbi:MAG TPA: carboxypeptidase-like regulatory domain-containing protein [Gemmatimonadota bacterium]|nr:carboxypeptidase-like regulatory domain-containing protein [Gemmatimonadota bacterium]
MNAKQALRTGATALALLASVAGAGLAQTGSGHALPAPGIVVGKVYDRETREPLVGGMVMLEDTSLGNVTNDDGSYFVSDVPSGSYRVRADYLGYESVTHSVRIGPGARVTVDFALGSDLVLADAIVAVLEKEPIPVTPPVKDYRISSEVQTHVPDEMTEASCRVVTTVHGSYIVDGQWQLAASVGHLLCGDQVIECRPVVVRKPDLVSAAETGSGLDSSGSSSTP